MSNRRSRLLLNALVAASTRHGAGDARTARVHQQRPDAVRALGRLALRGRARSSPGRVARSRGAPPARRTRGCGPACRTAPRSGLGRRLRRGRPAVDAVGAVPPSRSWSSAGWPAVVLAAPPVVAGAVRCTSTAPVAPEHAASTDGPSSDHGRRGGGGARRTMLGATPTDRGGRARSLPPSMRMGPHSMMGADPERVKGAVLKGSVVRRAWGFARPYRWPIIGFLVTIAFDAVIGLVPPLLFRAILDTAIPDARQDSWSSSSPPIVVLRRAGRRRARRRPAVVLARRSVRVSSTSCGRRCSTRSSGCRSRSSPGRRPGALISRLNNDVIGAQSAVTGTLGLGGVATSSPSARRWRRCCWLEWRLTLLTLDRAAALHRPGQAGGPGPAADLPSADGDQRQR